MHQDHEYEFLDLSDVDDNERTRLSSALLQRNDKIASVPLNDVAVPGQCRSTGNECRLPSNIHANSIAFANSSWPNRVANGKLNIKNTQHTNKQITYTQSHRHTMWNKICLINSRKLIFQKQTDTKIWSNISIFEILAVTMQYFC